MASTKKKTEDTSKVVFPANATFDKPLTVNGLEKLSGVFAEIVMFVKFGIPFRIVGPSGYGKSAIMKMIEQIPGERMLLDVGEGVDPEKPLRVFTLQATAVTPSDMVSTFPVKSKEDAEYRLRTILPQELQRKEGEPWILVIDEASRADGFTKSMLNEIVQERSLSGISLNVQTVVLTDNDASEGIGGGLDPSLMSRLVTINLTPNKVTTGINDLGREKRTFFSTDAVPWKFAIADKFPDVDLKKLFEAYDKYKAKADVSTQVTLSPRVVEKLIWNIVNGLPAELALGIRDSRNWIMNDAGENITDEVTTAFRSALGNPPLKQMDRALQTIIDLGVTQRKNFIVHGAPGIGKTAQVMAALRETGFADEDIIYFSGPSCTPEDFFVQIPQDGKLVTVLVDTFQRNATTSLGKVVVFDEFYRPHPSVMNAMLSITNEGRLVDIPITDLRCVIALTNPKSDDLGDYDTFTPDRAQSDRFFMSAFIGEDDTDWVTALKEQYKLVLDLEPWFSWREEHLNDVQRKQISPRVLELMIKLHLAAEHHGRTAKLDMALPRELDPVEGIEVPVDVPISALLKAIAGERGRTFDRVIADVDEICEKLKDPGHTEHIIVGQILDKTAVSKLEKHPEEIAKILSALTKERLVTLLASCPEGENRDSRQAALQKLLAAAKS